MIDFRGAEYSCQMEVTLELIGGKWKMLLLYKLGENGVMRFNELGRLHPKLTQKMLAQQLRELEADRLVNRKSYNQVPPKVEYSLTPRGASLLPILESMIGWGREYIEEEKGSDSAASRRKGGARPERGLGGDEPVSYQSPDAPIL
jgi:DNA-binding HxlR family transcriptional regulator